MVANGYHNEVHQTLGSRTSGMKIKVVNNWRVSLKRPYYALVAGKPLVNEKGLLRKFASYEAAHAAATKHVQQMQPLTVPARSHEPTLEAAAC
jgi:hypothetical protein